MVGSDGIVASDDGGGPIKPLDPLFAFAASIGIGDPVLDAAYTHEQSSASVTVSKGAFDAYLESARRGSVLGMCLVAHHCLHGKIEEFGPANAAQWAQRASDTGFAPAHFLLGFCFERGIGVSQDNAMALELYERAAIDGYCPAANHLALAYSTGRLGSIDMEKAVTFASMTARADDAIGAMWLAQWYEEGKGVPRNLQESLRWYLRAASLGNALASFRLSTAYSFGELGLVPDVEKARHYREMADGPIIQELRGQCSN